jgi:hypothetical protein
MTRAITSAVAKSRNQRVRFSTLIAFVAAGLGPTPLLASSKEPSRPKLFLSCPQQCFEPYLRQELSFFDVVRDPHLADVTLVIVRQPSAGGGERFSVTPATRRGASDAPPMPIPRAIVAAPGTAAHAARERLLRLVLGVLYTELIGTEYEDAFQLSLPTRGGAALSTLADPWNYWVVTPELSGEGDGGSGYFSIEGTAALTLRRITSLDKVRLRGAYVRRWSGFRLEDGSRIRGDVSGWDTRTVYARSLAEHWALGVVATGRSSEYENLQGHIHGGPLAEYNLFPYSQNASRQVRLAYQAGVWANWYFEENEAQRLREARPYHALSLIVDVNQPWGSIQWVGQANSFLDDPERYRLSSGAVLSLRLFEGLAVNFEGKAALVRDLINLRRRTIRDEELLLWTAEQPTDYTFEGKLAITYTFGSVHNTIVNPRFGRVDLDEE